jgi:transposase-like protein
MAKSTSKKRRNQAVVDTTSTNKKLSDEIHSFARTDAIEFVLTAGIKALQELVEDEILKLCGDRYKNVANRVLTRWGSTESAIVLGGKRVLIERGRVRDKETKCEVRLKTLDECNSQDLLAERQLESMLIGVSSRKFVRSQEARLKDNKNYADSKSTVSRNFVLKTKQKLYDWLHTRITEDYPIIMIDGTVFKKTTIIIVLGIDKAGNKRVLGAWDGSTENSRVCSDLLQSLIERGLRPEGVGMAVIDGGKAIHKSIMDIFGPAVLIQRCQVHKQRNVLEYVPKEIQHRVQWEMADAYKTADYATAKKTLDALGRWLGKDNESAARSLAEGLEETLLMHKLGITGALRKSLASTNLIENLNSRIKAQTARVRRWKNQNMVMRWAYTGISEAEKGFRKIRGCKDINKLLLRIAEYREKGFISLDTSGEAA